MRGNHPTVLVLSALMLAAALPILGVAEAEAGLITFSGTVSYSGAYAADTLYVAVLDTNTAGQEPTFIVVGAYPVGAPPYSQPFEVTFDNAMATGPLIVAAALDVDGGGLATIGGGDVIGWYSGTPNPSLVSAAASLSGLDFAMPRAEIRGTVTFGPDQSSAYVGANVNPDCQGDSFQPQVQMGAEGAYAMLGLYPGTYCVHGGGVSASIGWIGVCYGDPTCAAPTLVTLTTSQVVNGVDLDFSVITPNEPVSWGALKSAYR